VPHTFWADSVLPPEDEKKKALMGFELNKTVRPVVSSVDVELTAAFQSCPYFASVSFA